MSTDYITSHNSTQEISNVQHFKNLYYILSRCEKKIWDYLHWFCNHYKTVQPSHAHIAEKCECSRRTVITVIKKFVNLGWLGVLKRNWETSIYFIAEKFLKLDLKNPKTFSRKPAYEENCTVNCTVNCTRIKDTPSQIVNVGVESSKDSFNKKPRNIKVHHMLENVPISEEAKHFLSKYSKQVVGNTLEDYVSYAKKRTVWNLAGFLIKRCSEYIKGNVKIYPRKTKDSGAEDKTKETFIDSNIKFLESLKYLDCKTVGSTYITVSSKYIGFSSGNAVKDFHIDDPDLKQKTIKYLNLLGVTRK